MHWCIHTPIWLNTYKPKWLNTYKPKWLHTYKPIWLHTYKPIWLYTYIPSSATITLLHYFTYTIGLSSLDKFMHASLPPFRGFISLSFFDPHTLSLSPFSISLTLWLQHSRMCCNLSLSLFLAISLTRIDQCPSTCRKWTNEEKNLFFVKSKVTTTKEFWNVKIARIIFASVIALTTLVLDWLDQILLSSYCQLVINK